MRIRSKEVYGILRMLMEGEAKTVIRDNTDGFQAWQSLHSTYSRQTLARTLRIIKEAINPNKATTVHEVISRINEWESKLVEADRLEGNAGALHATIKLSILTEICPPEVKQMIFTIVKTEKTKTSDETYKDIRDQIMS